MITITPNTHGAQVQNQERQIRVGQILYMLLFHDCPHVCVGSALRGYATCCLCRGYVRSMCVICCGSWDAYRKQHP